MSQRSSSRVVTVRPRVAFGGLWLALSCGAGELGSDESEPAGMTPTSPGPTGQNVGAPSPSSGGPPAPNASAMASSAPSGPVLPATEPVEVFDPNAIPTDVPRVAIEIGDAERASLEADLWGAEDVLGTFIDGARYEGVELNYRGAYQLLNLVSFGETRNWKVKFSKLQDYLGRREWNFNFEPHLRQKLAYDLMRFAGVRVPEASHVVLSVNGRSYGPYLRYADPDDEAWLEDAFGSAAGDLFKAAHDLPRERAYFADLTVLGDTSQDYFLHYNKKSNRKGAAAEDFSSLVDFIRGLNQSPEVELSAWFERSFEVRRFISYLAVSNFMCNWDSYPQRPKNYWLYQSPVTSKWNYIPWDMDGTFQTSESFNYSMPTHASIFNEFDSYMGLSGSAEAEGTERPLVRRLMSLEAHRRAYVERYRELLEGVLSESYLLDRITDLTASLEPHVSDEHERDALRRASEDMEEFVRRRSASVRAELSSL